MEKQQNYKKIKHFCPECGEEKEVILQGKVPQKISIFYYECEKGHINEVFIGKELQKVMGME